MPRRTYSRKKGRRGPTPPGWANFDWLVSELLKLNAQNRHERTTRR